MCFPFVRCHRNIAHTAKFIAIVSSGLVASLYSDPITTDSFSELIQSADPR
jgi:hypothetical protein